MRVYAISPSGKDEAGKEARDDGFGSDFQRGLGPENRTAHRVYNSPRGIRVKYHSTIRLALVSRLFGCALNISVMDLYEVNSALV